MSERSGGGEDARGGCRGGEREEETHGVEESERGRRRTGRIEPTFVTGAAACTLIDCDVIQLPAAGTLTLGQHKGNLQQGLHT